MANEEMRPSINEYLDDVKEGIETPSNDSRLSAIENGMLNLRSKIRSVRISPEEEQPQQQEEVSPKYDKLTIADAAVDVYRSNIQEKEEKKEEPCTRASRANTKAMIRSLSGSQSSGNSGKTSYEAGPNGSGDTGAPVPGNVTVPPLDTMAVEGTEESIEDYQARIFESFGLDEACWTGYTQKGMKKKGSKVVPNCVKEEAPEKRELQIKASRGDKEAMKKLHQLRAAGKIGKEPGFAPKSEGVVEDLEDILLELNDTSWQSIDKAMRELCQENDITPKELHKDFKTKHGMIPDQWIKEQEVTEECGWFPLDEMVRVNKIGQVYDVSFLFRGGTSRFKFFWPAAQRPSRKEMQQAVEKFYPRARLLAFYPAMDNDDNYMVMVPPMTENYEIIPEDTWLEMSEECDDVYQQICEELGEPMTPPVLDEETGQITMMVEDHDTGEEHEVMWEANKSGDSSLRDWFTKSKASDGTPGWVQLGGKFSGKPCAKQPGQTTKPKCGSSKMKRNLDKDEEQAAFRRKNREDGNPDRKGKAKNVRTEEYINEVSDKKVKKLVKGRERNVEKALNHSPNFPGWNKRVAGAMKKADKTDDLVRSREKRMAKEDYKSDKSYNAPSLPKKTKKERDDESRFDFSPERPPKGGRNWLKDEFIPEAKGMEGMTQKGGHKRSTESGAGLTQKGVEKYRRQNPGSKLKTAVTTPPSKLKAGSKAAGRRKSFCARSKGWDGERGKAARRRWNC